MAGKQVSLVAAMAVVSVVVLASGCGMLLMDGRAKNAERNAKNAEMALELEKLRHLHTLPADSTESHK